MSASVSREALISMDRPFHSSISVFLWGHWDWGSKEWQHIQGERATAEAIFGVIELRGWDDPFRGSKLLGVIVIRMESLAEDWKLSACGRQPSSFFLIIWFYFLCFSCDFQDSVCHSSLGERFSFSVPNLHHYFGIVSLVTLGTMCHSSLGVG
jgi:hypothetical protein